MTLDFGDRLRTSAVMAQCVRRGRTALTADRLMHGIFDEVDRLAEQLLIVPAISDHPARAVLAREDDGACPAGLAVRVAERLFRNCALSCMSCGSRLRTASPVAIKVVGRIWSMEMTRTSRGRVRAGALDPLSNTGRTRPAR